MVNVHLTSWHFEEVSDKLSDSTTYLCKEECLNLVLQFFIVFVNFPDLKSHVAQQVHQFN